MVGSVEKKLRSGSFTGILLGTSALLACELPIILAMVGFGSLSATASVLKPPYWAEVTAVMAVGVGSVVLIVVLVRRRWKQVKPSAE